MRDSWRRRARPDAGHVHIRHFVGAAAIALGVLAVPFAAGAFASHGNGGHAHPAGQASAAAQAAAGVGVRAPGHRHPNGASSAHSYFKYIKVIRDGHTKRIVVVVENAAGRAVQRVVGSRDPFLGVGTGSIGAVSCPAVGRCVAVGGSSALSWNGTTWTKDTLPKPPHPVGLEAVSCTDATHCLAAGSYEANYNQYPFAERLSGSTWSVLPNPPAIAHASGTIMGVACPSATACVAVGEDGATENGSGNQMPYATEWNGTSWRQTSIPVPPGYKNPIGNLDSVSCESATDCTAVGFYGTGYNPGTVALAEHWNGSAWSLEKVPLPTRSPDANLTAVSCVPGGCEAVGFLVSKSTGNELGYSARWTGAAWIAATRTYTPRGSISPELYGISCTSASACVAVGNSGHSGPQGSDRLLIETFNGTSWSLANAPQPNSSELHGVSCSAARSCTAVGDTFGYGFNRLALGSNGITWVVETTP
jgi:hypothetical protein